MTNYCEDSYIAGFLDGDGCVTIIKTKNYINGKVFFRPKIEFVNRDLEILKFIQSKFGGQLTMRKQYNPRWRNAFVLTITGHKNLKNFLGRIGKYLISKKKQGELILKFIISRKRRRTRTYLDNEIKIVEEIRDLNRGNHYAKVL